MQFKCLSTFAGLVAILSATQSLEVAGAGEQAESQAQFERAVALAHSANSLKDVGLREKRLEEAQAALREFVSEHPQDSLAHKAMLELGYVLVRRASSRVEQAKQPALESGKQALLNEARGMYDEATKQFAAMTVDLRARLEALPKALAPKGDVRLIELRDQLRADYLQAQILRGAVLEEMADTESKGSMAYNDTLLAAAKEYHEIYSKYRTRLAGLYARLYQGRCHVKLGDYKEAMACLDLLIDQPDQPQEFRDLKVRTLILAAECWLGSMPQDHKSAILYLKAFLTSASPDERKSELLLSLQLWLAKAYLGQGETLVREPEGKAKVAESLEKAKSLIEFVLEQPGESQAEAKELIKRVRALEGLAN